MKTRVSFLFCLLLTAAATVPLSAAIIDDWRIRHPLPYNANLFNAAYGNGVYVMVGAGGAIITTSDLEHWHTIHHPELVENVVFADGQFVVSGFEGDMLVSVDGTNWTTYPSGSSMAFSGLAYGNGLYVAAGEQGVTAVSSNGVDWTVSSTGQTNGWYYGVAYGAGRFVAVSVDAEFDVSGTIATSTDGVAWTIVNLPPGLPYMELWDVDYGGGRFTAIGYFYDAVPDVDGVLILTSTALSMCPTMARAGQMVPPASTAALPAQPMAKDAGS